MRRRRLVLTGVVGAVLVVMAGYVLGVVAPGPLDSRVSDGERKEVTSYARAMLLDNPFQGLLLLSTKVERIPDGSALPCDPFLGALGVPAGTAWHVTGYGPFGLRIGGGTITCSGDASVDAA